MLRHHTGSAQLRATGLHSADRTRHVAHFQRPNTLPSKQQLQQTTVSIPTPETLPTAAGPGISPDAAAKMQATLTLVHKKPPTPEASPDALSGFLLKCRLAWNIFFPPTAAAAPPLSPSELGRQRLSMILVADRCGLSPSSLVEMKRDTVRALQDVMDLEELQDAHLRFTMVREGGTTYSLAVPVLHNALLDAPGGAEAAAAGPAGPSMHQEDLEDIDLVDPIVDLSMQGSTAQNVVPLQRQQWEEVDTPAKVQQQAPAAASVDAPAPKKPAFVDVVEEDEDLPVPVVSSIVDPGSAAQEGSSSGSSKTDTLPAPAAAVTAGGSKVDAVTAPQKPAGQTTASHTTAGAAARPPAATAAPAAGQQAAAAQGPAAEPQQSYSYERFVADVEAAEGVDHQQVLRCSSAADAAVGAVPAAAVGEVAVGAASAPSQPAPSSSSSSSSSRNTSPRSSKKRGRKGKKRGTPKPQSS